MALERDVEIQDEQERLKAKAKMLQATEAENTNNKPINEAMLVRLLIYLNVVASTMVNTFRSSSIPVYFAHVVLLSLSPHVQCIVHTMVNQHG